MTTVQTRTDTTITQPFFKDCASLADVNCLVKYGWTIREISIEVAIDTLSKRTVPVYVKLKNKFCSTYKVNDHVYYYSYPKEYWEQGIGRDGLMICRKDTLVSEIVLTLN
jgi:hypothetical protein